MVIVCRHTPTRTQRALYWFHIIWNHFPDFEPGDKIIRLCLLVDWLDGLTDRCPSCLWDTLEDGSVHLHHAGDEDCVDD